MKLKINDFIEILGCTAKNKKVKRILDILNLPSPILEKNKDTVWYEIDDTGYDLAFKDASIINNDEYADIGDGELIFMAAYFNKVDKVILPFGIDGSDNYEEILSKIGKIEDDDYKLLNEKTWIFKTKNNLEYILFFDFNDDYSQIEKLGVLYSYGQLSWVEELKKSS